MNGKTVRPEDAARDSTLRDDASPALRVGAARALRVDAAPLGTGGGPSAPDGIGLVDLGAASARTRGSYSGFIIEPSSFPLRDA